jgi:cobalt transporter subunit CbtB
MTNAKVNTASHTISQRLSAGLVCLFVGATLVFSVGLSHMTFAHNAAHDTRHAIGFPCH